MKLVTIKAVELADSEIDPYVIAFDANDQRLFTTPYVSGTTKATWSEIDVPSPCLNGQPIFFEIWDSNSFSSDELVGGFVIYPEASTDSTGRAYTSRISWNWKERSKATRNGIAQVLVEFTRRAEDPE